MKNAMYLQWNGFEEHGKCENATWIQVEESIRKMDGNTVAEIYFETKEGSICIRGGEANCYIVCIWKKEGQLWGKRQAIENGFTTIKDVESDGIEVANSYIIDRNMVLQTAAEFFHNGAHYDQLKWDANLETNEN